VPTVLKSGTFNLLEHSGPVQVCTEIPLPLVLKWRRRWRCRRLFAYTDSDFGRVFYSGWAERSWCAGTVNNSEPFPVTVACYYVVFKQPLPRSTAFTALSLSWSDLLRRRTEFLLLVARVFDACSFSTWRWGQSAPSGGGKGPNGSPHSTPSCGSSSSSGSNCDVLAPTSTQISHYRGHRPSFSSTGTVCLWTTEFFIELNVILTPSLPYMNFMSVENTDSLLRLQLAFIYFHLSTHELSTTYLHQPTVRLSTCFDCPYPSPEIVNTNAFFVCRIIYIPAVRNKYLKY